MVEANKNEIHSSDLRLLGDLLEIKAPLRWATLSLQLKGMLPETDPDYINQCRKLNVDPFSFKCIESFNGTQIKFLGHLSPEGYETKKDSGFWSNLNPFGRPARFAGIFITADQEGLAKNTGGSINIVGYELTKMQLRFMSTDPAKSAQDPIISFCRQQASIYRAELLLPEGNIYREHQVTTAFKQLQQKYLQEN